METPADRLKKARLDAGFPTVAEAVRRFGFKRSAYVHHESGQNGIRPAVAEKYAKAYKVTAAWLLYGDDASKKPQMDADVKTVTLPIVGKVQAGVWLVVDLVDQSEFSEKGVMVPSDPRWQEEHQYAVQIVGDSINEFAESGSYAHCVDVSSGIQVAHGNLVVVERIRAQGAEIERTIKQFQLVDGHAELHPRSRNPKHHGPIEMQPENGEDVEVRIKAVVVNFINPAPGFGPEER